jgi:hypothetical protein
MSDVVIFQDNSQREKFSASIEGVYACGTGESKEEAVENLAALLGDFVKGRDKTIDELLARVRTHEPDFEFSLPLAEVRGSDPPPPSSTA